MSRSSHLARRWVLHSALCLAAPLAFAAETPAAGASREPAAPGSTTVSAVTLRNPGGRTRGAISVSLQNEINAAIDRGRAWLLACQNADGTWGSNDCLRLTAIATLALAHNPSPAEKDAVDKAGKWMLSPAATNTPIAWHAEVETLAWRELALQVATPADPPRTARLYTNLLMRVQAATGGAIFNPFATMLLREALAPRDVSLNGQTTAFSLCSQPTAPEVAAACVKFMPSPASAGPAAQATNTLAQLAALWSPRQIPLVPGCATARQYWVLAHFINRASGGTLADAQGNVLDWRSDLARTLVETQKIDADRQGNGYWRDEAAPADWAGQPVAETAFSLLALDEL